VSDAFGNIQRNQETKRLTRSTYSGLYDKFLIVVGLGWNAATAWYAWTSYP
jgi:hypothetical protein